MLTPVQIYVVVLQPVRFFSFKRAFDGAGAFKWKKWNITVRKQKHNVKKPSNFSRTQNDIFVDFIYFIALQKLRSK